MYVYIYSKKETLTHVESLFSVFLENLRQCINPKTKSKDNMVMCCQQQIISSFLFRIIFSSFILFTLLNHLPTNSFYGKNYDKKQRY